MPIKHIDEIEMVKMDMEGAVEVFKQVAIGPNEGWNDYVMRIFTVKPGGNTPKHAHPWPHINYIISGEGTILIDKEEFHVKEGSVAFIPDNKTHQFKNSGNSPFKFICIIPTNTNY